MRVRVNAVAACKISVKAMSCFSKTVAAEAPPDTSAISEMSD
jgi:hypothetical protein